MLCPELSGKEPCGHIWSPLRVSLLGPDPSSIPSSASYVVSKLSDPLVHIWLCQFSGLSFFCCLLDLQEHDLFQIPTLMSQRAPLTPLSEQESLAQGAPNEVSHIFLEMAFLSSPNHSLGHHCGKGLADDRWCSGRATASKGSLLSPLD